MAAIDRKGKDTAGIPGNGAGIVPWSLRNNGGTGEGITPSNGAKAGVTPTVRVYSADSGHLDNIDNLQPLATTAVYANNGPGALKDGAVRHADNHIIGGPKNNQSSGVPAGSDQTSTGITTPSPIKGIKNQYSK